MAQLLLKENCTVTVVHSKTNNLQEECLKADILVAAVGVPNLVKKDWVKSSAIVIDVGINKVGDKIVGDVKFCLLYTSPSPRDKRQSRMPSSA